MLTSREGIVGGDDPGGTRSAMEMSLRRVAKNTVSDAVSVAVSTGAGAVVTLAVARTSGPLGLGVFSPAWQLAMVVSVVAVTGGDQLVVRALNRGGARVDIERHLGLALAAGVAASVSVVAGSRVLAVGPDGGRAFAAAALFIAISPPAWILRAALRARERMELETVSVLAESAIGLGAALAVLWAGFGPAAVVAALAAGRLANVIAAWALLRPWWGGLRPRFDGRAWISAVRTGVPLGLAADATATLLRFDVIVVGAVVRGEQAGQYAAAAAVVAGAPMLATAFHRSLMPVFSRATGRTDPQLQRVFSSIAWKLAAAAVIVAGVLSVAGPHVVSLVFGSRFAEAGRILRVLAWIVPVRVLNSLLATTVNATGWSRGLGAVAGAVIVVHQLAYLVTVPLLGYWGAVWTLLVAESVLLAVLSGAKSPLRWRAPAVA